MGTDGTKGKECSDLKNSDSLGTDVAHGVKVKCSGINSDRGTDSSKIVLALTPTCPSKQVATASVR